MKSLTVSTDFEAVQPTVKRKVRRSFLFDVDLWIASTVLRAGGASIQRKLQRAESRVTVELSNLNGPPLLD